MSGGVCVERMCMQRPYNVKCNPCKTKKGGNKERVTGKKKKVEEKERPEDSRRESRGTSGVQSCPHTMGRVTHYAVCRLLRCTEYTMEYITVLELQKKYKFGSSAYYKDSRRIVESLKKKNSFSSDPNEATLFSPTPFFLLIRSRWSRPHRHATGTKLRRVWTLSCFYFLFFIFFYSSLVFVSYVYQYTLLVGPID